MALELIGQRYGATVLDIHTGGVDLIFPHHEDEIAQSCAYTGKPEFARVWMHAEFLNVRGTKMSKRFGNITTPRDLKQDGVDPGAIRLLVYQTHYRQRLDLTDEALAAAREGSRRLGEFARRFHAAATGVRGRGLCRSGGTTQGGLRHRAERRSQRAPCARRAVRFRDRGKPPAGSGRKSRARGPRGMEAGRRRARCDIGIENRRAPWHESRHARSLIGRAYRDTERHASGGEFGGVGTRVGSSQGEREEST